MKRLSLLAALVAAASLVAVSAEAATSKKRKAAASQNAAAVASHPHNVYYHDGDLLGRDPDPFIRLMIRSGGRIGDQEGH
jgi:hypothetical protein